jgi:septum formation protein
MRELILASTSPRRQDLLREIGIPFQVDAPQVEEWDAVSHPLLSPKEIAQGNARLKAEAVAPRHAGRVILAADTVVYCEGRLLGKPGHLREAAEMLAWLEGRTHEVLTAVVWIDCVKHEILECVERTWVTFRPLDEALIEAYLAKVHVLDKAGAYALQDHGFDLIERVEGCRSNVIGLPVEKVKEWISRAQSAGSLKGAV